MHFARLARPLNNHLEGDASKLKAHKVTLSRKAKEAFGLLKQALLQAPVLKFADYSKPFILETDASSDGLGAVLLQEGEDGKLHPVAYGSRSLTKAERNYHSGKTEFLALKWAVTDHFKEYLIYQPFVVRTDNNPLTYLFTTLISMPVGINGWPLSPILTSPSSTSVVEIMLPLTLSVG